MDNIQKDSVNIEQISPVKDNDDIGSKVIKEVDE